MKRAVFFYGGAVLLVAAMVGYYYALTVQTSWEAVGFKRFEPEGQYLDAGGGRRLRIWCEGVGRPGVLLEASGLAGADQYAELIAEVSRYTRVCAYDRAGMGYSEPLTGAVHLSDYTDDLQRVAERTGPPPWILVGGSYGGVVVQAYARQHPEKVGALVLLDAVVPDAFSLMDPPWKSLDASIRKAELVAPSGLLRSKDPLQLGDTKDAWLVYRASTWAAVRRLVATRTEARELFAKLPPLAKDLPLRVLRHDKVGDMMGPDFPMEESQKLEPAWQKVQEAFAAQSSRGKLIVAEGSGHLIVHDAMELVKDTIVECMPRVTEWEGEHAPRDAGAADAGNVHPGVDAGATSVPRSP